MKFKLTNQISVDIVPWTDLGLRPLFLYLTESIGGDLPTGTIKFQTIGTKEASEIVNKIVSGYITIEFPENGSPIYKFPIFTTSVSVDRNEVAAEFLCITDKKAVFNRDIQKLELNDPKKVIETLWRGEMDIRTDYDSQEVPIIYQNRQRSIDLCTDFCKSYRKNTIFGYSLRGLFIKDVVGKNWKGELEPTTAVLTGLDFTQEKMGRLESYDRSIFEETEDPWENIGEDRRPINMSVVRRGGHLAVLGKSIVPNYENFLQNSRFYQSNLPYLRVNTQIGWPGYTLGDTIYYRRGENMKKVQEDTRDVLHVVASNHIFIPFPGNPSKKSFSWSSELIGVTRSGEIFLEDGTKDYTEKD